MKHSSVITHFLTPTYRTLSMLSGIVLEEPEVFTQDSASTDDIIEAAIAHNELVFVRAAVGLVLFECVILRDFTKAADVILKYPSFFEVLNNRYASAVEMNVFFLAGLTSFQLARETRETHWTEKGTNALAAYENWLLRNRPNHEHKCTIRLQLTAGAYPIHSQLCFFFTLADLLLKAECHQLKGETDAAIDAYESSILSAHENKFVHNEAIACEMAAHFFWKHWQNKENSWDDSKVARFVSGVGGKDEGWISH